MLVVQATAVTGEEDIMAVSGLFIKQKLELLEVITGFETQNKYKVRKCERIIYGTNGVDRMQNHFTAVFHFILHDLDFRLMPRAGIFARRRCGNW